MVHSLAVDAPTAAVDTGTFCREVESHLCRRNDGHLVRIVGPAFDLVCGWAARGIPLSIACRGIDRTVERLQAKGPRRRPIRIEFCEADVLDAFDAWRRAVGVGLVRAPTPPGPDETTSVDDTSQPDASPQRTPSLRAHVRRAIERLARVDPHAARPPALESAVADIVSALGALEDDARPLRGDARTRALGRLVELDVDLGAAARATADAGTLVEIDEAARAELAPFVDRLAPAAFEDAFRRAADRLLRDRLRLPVIRLD
ncbi:MAG: hypothetical protein U0Q12_26355 [Vicinamibacterales bacterium]